MFGEDYGLAAAIAHALGLPAPYVLADPDWAMAAILVVIVWKFPYAQQRRHLRALIA
jgi:raffinose/stachyose/melibiose transport system permease protein